MKLILNTNVKLYAWRRNILNTCKNLIKIDCRIAVYGECITSQEYDVPDLYNNTIYMYIWCLTPLIYTDFFISWRLFSSLFGSEVRRLPDYQWVWLVQGLGLWLLLHSCFNCIHDNTEPMPYKIWCPSLEYHLRTQSVLIENDR